VVSALPQKTSIARETGTKETLGILIITLNAISLY